MTAEAQSATKTGSSITYYRECVICGNCRYMQWFEIPRGVRVPDFLGNWHNSCLCNNCGCRVKELD